MFFDRVSCTCSAVYAVSYIFGLDLLPYRISLIINSFENYLTPAIKIKNYNINRDSERV